MDNSVRENIYRELNELIEDEFKEFKWRLQGIDYDGKPNIPRGWLQDADKLTVVGLMIQNYGEEVALKVCIQVLQKCHKNNLAARLEITQKGAALQQVPDSSDYRSLIKGTFSTMEDPNSHLGEYVYLSERHTKLVIIDYPRPDKFREHEIMASGRKHAEIMNTRDNSSVTVEALFNLDKHGLMPQVIVLQGAAGIGKTMTVRRIMLDWASQQLYPDMFDYVFYINCREINVLASREEISFGEIISEQWPHGHAVKKTIDAILRNPKKLLFIIDGFDELKISFEQPKSCLCTDPWKKASISVILSSLFQKKVLPESYLIITTRPIALEKLHQCLKKPRYFEILGFSIKERKEYFHNFFGNKDQAFRALSFVAQNDPVFTMCVIPLVCWIICTVMKQEMEREDGPQKTPYTITAVYTLYLSSLIFHHQESNQDIQRILKGLSSLAVEGIGKQQIIFTEEELQHHDLNQKGSLSLFLNENIFKRDIQRIHTFNFIHLSFQEFFAALFYVLEEQEERCSENLNENLRRLLESSLVSKFDLTVTVRFLFGLLNEEKEMKEFKKRLGWKNSPKIKEFLLFWVKNLIKHKKNRNEELLQYLYELQDGNFLRTALEDMTVLQYTYRSAMELMILTYCLKYCHNLEDLYITESFETFKLEMDGELFPTEHLSNQLFTNFRTDSFFGHLAEVLKQNQSLRELCLSFEDMDEKGMKLLCDGLKHPDCKLLKLSLFGQITGESSWRHLAKVLRENQSLRELQVCLKDTGMELLCDGLKHPDCKLLKLSLFGQITGESSWRHLDKVLRENQSLRELQVCLKDTGMELLGEGLKHPNCKLQKLCLLATFRTESCWRYFAEVLRLNQSLRELEICSVDTDEKKMEPLYEGLKQPDCKLEKLSILEPLINECHWRHLADVLRENQSLRELAFPSWIVDEKGMELLCEGLKHPDCKLQKLSLSWQPHGKSSCRHLAEGLKENQSLRDLDISSWDTDEEEIELLCEGLKHPTCRLEKLRFQAYFKTENCWRHLAEVLRENQTLRELHLFSGDLNEQGMKLLGEELKHPECKLQKLSLLEVFITESCWRHLAEVLKENQSLRELEIFPWDTDEKVMEVLCEGLKHSDCKLEKIRVNDRVVEMNYKDDVSKAENKEPETREDSVVNTGQIQLTDQGEKRTAESPFQKDERKKLKT